MKLTRCYIIGRYVNPTTGRAVNVHKGSREGRGDAHLFYLFRGKRVFIMQGEFYGANGWKRATPTAS